MTEEQKEILALKAQVDRVYAYGIVAGIAIGAFIGATIVNLWR